MSDYLTIDDVRQLLQSRQGDRTQEDLAREIGISYQFLGHILRGVRSPGKDVLKFLGLRKLTVYQRDRR